LEGSEAEAVFSAEEDRASDHDASQVNVIIQHIYGFPESTRPLGIKASACKGTVSDIYATI
jgi:hypothetical protein